MNFSGIVHIPPRGDRRFIDRNARGAGLVESNLFQPFEVLFPGAECRRIGKY